MTQVRIALTLALLSACLPGAGTALAAKDALFLGKIKISPSVEESAAASTTTLHRFRDALDSALLQELGRSSRFSLVDRRNMQALEDEEKLADFLNGGALALEITPPKYAVMANIDGFQEVMETRRFPAVGKVDMKRNVTVSVALKVIDMGTRQVLPGITGVQLAKDERKKMVEPAQGVPSDTLILEMAKEAASQIIHESMGTLYPPKVLDLSGNQIMINRGEPAGFRAGVAVVIYLEKPVQDPDSGTTLMNEIQVGTAEVIRADDQRSFAEVTENLGIQPGCVARPQE